MSAAEILTAEQLQNITGFKREADVIRCLREQGIVVFVGKNGPWTTQALIELAGRVKLGLENPDPAKRDYF